MADTAQTVQQDLKIKLSFDTGTWKKQTGEAVEDLDQLNQRFKTTARNTEKASRGAKEFGKAMRFVIGLGVAQYMKDSALALDRVGNRMKFATNSVEEFGEAMAFSAETANELGLALIPTQRGLATLQASAKGTSLAGKEIEELFKGISQASGALSLTADETNSVFLAFSQIISKGKVQAEELRSQIGERIPGALNLAQKALGVTGAELDKLLQSGSLMADDLLPKLAKEFQNTFGEQAEKNATSLTAQLNKVQNSLKIISGEAFKWAEDTFRVLEGYNKIAEVLESSNIIARSEDELVESTKKKFKDSAVEKIKLLNEQNASVVEQRLELKKLEEQLRKTINPLKLDSEASAELSGYLRAVTGQVKTGYGAGVFDELNKEIGDLNVANSALINDAIRLSKETQFYNSKIEETIRLSKQLKEVNKIEDDRKAKEGRDAFIKQAGEIAEEIGDKQKEQSKQRVKELNEEKKVIREKISLLKQAQSVNEANAVNFLSSVTAGSNADVRLSIEARTRGLGATAGNVDIAQRNADELEEQTRLLKNIEEKLDVERVQ